MAGHASAHRILFDGLVCRGVRRSGNRIVFHSVSTCRHRNVVHQRIANLVLEDFFAPTTESYLGLSRFLLGLDLIDRVVFSGRCRSMIRYLGCLLVGGS